MKRYIFITLMTFILLFYFSCQADKGKRGSDSPISFLTDTILIDISGFELPTYYYFSHFYDTSINQMVFVGYNHFEHSYDFFDLKNAKLMKKTLLNTEGPDGIVNSPEFCFIAHDTILISENQFVYKISLDGNVFLKKSKAEIQKENDFLFGRGLEVRSPANSIAYFNGRSFFHILPINAGYWEKEFYEGPVLASVNLENGLVHFLDIRYPKGASADRLFGYLLKPYMMVYKDNLIFNYPFSSKVYKYNCKSGDTQEFDIRSGITNNESKPFTYSANSGRLDQLKHFLNSLHFHKLVYDPWRNLFFRVHTSELKTPDDITSREIYLCVFDTLFNKIGEFPLDKGLFYNNYFATEDGLLFQVNNIDDMENINKLRFCRFRFLFE